ncbi:MAG: YciI family protein [Methyloceanibacter sp.]|uniref:YciI family protein n=1 Tax=Methyloceanibacter sp. TaxID=1965321 RepID=UPI003D6D7183
MRFISMVKFRETNAAPPPKEFLEAMGALTREAAEAGCVMTAGEGLLPTAKAARVRLDGGKVSIMDGPFTEAKEVIGGFAIFEAQSMDEMVKWARRMMDLHKAYLPGWQGECEIRQIGGPGEKLCDQVAEEQATAV